jgi:hypothetical protein
LGVESLPALTLSLITLGVLGPVGGGIVLTGGGGLEGYANGLVGALTKAGVDVSRPDELVRALQDKDLMDRARGEATTDGAIEAGITAVSMVAGAGGALKPGKLSRAEQLAKNRVASQEHEKELAASLAKRQNLDFGPQVTVEPPGGPPVRVDFITRDRVTGQIGLIEAKSSETARLTPRQKLGHPRLETLGGTIKGEGKPGFEGGLTIPPTKVQILRKGPGDVD